MAKMNWKSVEEIEIEKAEAERQASLPSELETLQAQLTMMEMTNELLEDALLEMASEVYK